MTTAERASLDMRLHQAGWHICQTCGKLWRRNTDQIPDECSDCRARASQTAPVASYQSTADYVCGGHGVERLRHHYRDGRAI